MGDKSAIEWTDASWNPILGCTKVSAGCTNCYPIPIAARLARMGMRGYEGLTRKDGARPQWTGEVHFVESVIELPLRWKAPRRIFVNSMSDLFHEKVEDEWIERIFAVMYQATQHTFQILTKRPERMARLLNEAAFLRRLWRRAGQPMLCARAFRTNVWLGVSVEDQATFDERYPLLRDTPAAVRFISYEPALSCVQMGRLAGIRWVIVGGESGPGARPFDLAWARSTIAQCRAAGIPVFVKQLGSRPITYTHTQDHDRGLRMNTDGALTPPTGLRPGDRKGGDMAEWPEDLRIRDFPA